MLIRQHAQCMFRLHAIHTRDLNKYERYAEPNLHLRFHLELVRRTRRTHPLPSRAVRLRGGADPAGRSPPRSPHVYVPGVVHKIIGVHGMIVTLALTAANVTSGIDIISENSYV